MERNKFLEEQKELEDFERMQQESREKELKERLELEKKVPRKGPVTAPSGSSKRTSQLKLLAGAVKRKTASDEAEMKKIKTQDKSEAPPGLLGLAAYGSDDSDSGSE